jgi:hypothetical protein
MAKDCPKDPNLKTSVEPQIDHLRVARIKSKERKLFSDTMVTTTHMLKNCVKVPKEKGSRDDE